VFSNLKKIGLNDWVVERTTMFKGIGAGRVYETSSAGMPMRAIGTYSCGLINPTCAVASQINGPSRLFRGPESLLLEVEKALGSAVQVWCLISKFSNVQRPLLHDDAQHAVTVENDFTTVAILS